MTNEQREKLLDAAADIGAALMQMLPTDDQIIAARVKSGYEKLKSFVEDTRADVTA